MFKGLRWSGFEEYITASLCMKTMTLVQAKHSTGLASGCCSGVYEVILHRDYVPGHLPNCFTLIW